MLSTRFFLSFAFVAILSTAFAQPKNSGAVSTENQSNSAKAIKTPNQNKTVNSSPEVEKIEPKMTIEHLGDKPGLNTESLNTGYVEEAGHQAYKIYENDSTSGLNATIETNDIGLMLRPISKEVIAPNTIKITCDLVVKSTELIYGAGVNGIIDLSEFLLKEDDPVTIVPYSGLLFKSTDFVYTNYNPVVKELYFILSKTDNVDVQINKPLLRIAIIFEEDIVGTRDESSNIRSANIVNSEIILSNGGITELRSTKNKFLNINTRPFTIGNELMPDLNLVVKNIDCDNLGSAELCIPENINANLFHVWSNGRTSLEIKELQVGNYFVNITHPTGVVRNVPFEIINAADVEEDIYISNKISVSRKYIASESINLNNGVDIPKNRTVEFSIMNCD